TPTHQAVLSPPPPLTREILGPAEKVSAELWPGVPLVPTMSSGATDGRFTSNAGIPTYGLNGMFRDPDGGGTHGLNERIRVRSLYEGHEYLYRVVKLYAGGKSVAPSGHDDGRFHPVPHPDFRPRSFDRRAPRRRRTAAPAPARQSAHQPLLAAHRAAPRARLHRRCHGPATLRRQLQAARQPRPLQLLVPPDGAGPGRRDARARFREVLRRRPRPRRAHDVPHGARPSGARAEGGIPRHPAHAPRLDRGEHGVGDQLVPLDVHGPA